MPLDVVNIYVRPILVAHGYETPSCFMSWIVQEPFFYITQMEGFDQAYFPFKDCIAVLTRSTEGLSAPLAR
jgi:hypothetical protein